MCSVARYLLKPILLLSDVRVEKRQMRNSVDGFLYYRKAVFRTKDCVREAVFGPKKCPTDAIFQAENCFTAVAS